MKKKYKPTYHKGLTGLYIKWVEIPTKANIICRAKDRDIEIDEEAADCILETVERHCDCTVGIDWVAVDDHIDYYLTRIEMEEEK